MSKIKNYIDIVTGGKVTYKYEIKVFKIFKRWFKKPEVMLKIIYYPSYPPIDNKEPIVKWLTLEEGNVINITQSFIVNPFNWKRHKNQAE